MKIFVIEIRKYLMPKSSKRFVISDDSLNRHGYRVLTAGVDMEQFLKNPIMLWMHGRAWGNKKEDVLPLGHWQDIEVKNNQITGVPFFSDDDEFAMSIYKKVEEGTIRMASAGLDPIETSEDEENLVQGQRYPTVTKSRLLEASIVDMGSNDNACALYNNGTIIQLADGDYTNTFIPLLKNKNSNNMNEHLLALAITLGLGAKATEIELAEKMNQEYAELIKLRSEHTTLKTSNTELQTKYDALVKSTSEKEVNDFLTLAVENGQITEAQKADFITLAATNFEAVKNTINKMPKHVTAEAKLSAEIKDSDPLLKLSYKELHKKAGALATVKEKYPDHFKTIFREHFGKDPK